MQDLSLSPTAVVHGDLIVHGRHRPEIPPGAKVLGQVRFDQVEQRGGAWGWLGWWLFLFLALLVVGWAALAMFPGWLGRASAAIRERPGASTLAGLIGLLLTPIIIGLLLITVIGIPLALILLALYGVAILMSDVLVAYRLGGWLPRGTSRPWLQMLLGVLIVSFLVSLPWAGWLAQSIALVIGFGALALGAWRSRRPAQAAACIRSPDGDYACVQEWHCELP